MTRLEEWWASGRRVPARGDDAERELFVHHAEGGSTVTLLHGFPSSSWDFAPLVERLHGPGHLAPDLLGFGASEKPAEPVYGFDAQLSRLLDLWDRFEVERTWLVAHDYSVSIAEEILARISEGRWSGPRIEAVSLLNGGLLYAAIDRKWIQDALRAPVLGPVLARALPAWGFRRQFSDVFADAQEPSRDELDQHWQALTAHEGRAAMAYVARYLDERREREARWRRALVNAPVPVRYVWGLEDPVSGRSVLAALRAAVPDADVVELPGVGHYPHLEAPARVHDALLLPDAGAR